MDSVTNAPIDTSDPPLFASVTDSLSQVASYALSAPSIYWSSQNNNEEEESNVHGVDSTSLLAIPNVGRNTNNQRSNEEQEHDFARSKNRSYD
jgi:hypothetical protein